MNPTPQAWQHRQLPHVTLLAAPLRPHSLCWGRARLLRQHQRCLSQGSSGRRRPLPHWIKAAGSKRGECGLSHV